MFPEDDLDQLSRREGCRVEVDVGEVRLLGLRGLGADGTTILCDLRKSTAGDAQQAGTAEGAIHAIGINTRGHSNGWLHEADGGVIGNQLSEGADGWRFISLGQSDGKPENARELLARYGRHIVGAVAAKETGLIDAGTKTLGQIAAETYETRANLVVVQERIRDLSVAIVGLGGTGSYIFDLLARTPVKRIVIVDNDEIHLKNLMRCPGGVDRDTMKRVHQDRIKKVHYYESTHSDLPVEIIALAEYANGDISERLKELDVGFVFVAMGHSPGYEHGRPDDVYAGLAMAEIPFIDSGISLRLEGGRLAGSVRITRCAAGASTWEQDIPKVGLKGAEDLYHNIQLPEVNSLGAVMAVLEWRRMSGQYQDETRGTRVAKYDIEGNQILLGGKPHENTP